MTYSLASIKKNYYVLGLMRYYLLLFNLNSINNMLLLSLAIYKILEYFYVYS